MLSDMNKSALWTKCKTACLCRYNPSGQYFARVRHGGKHYRRVLETKDYQLARRKLADFKTGLDRTDPTTGNTSLGEVLKTYERTIGNLSEKSQKDKRTI